MFFCKSVHWSQGNHSVFIFNKISANEIRFVIEYGIQLMHVILFYRNYWTAVKTNVNWKRKKNSQIINVNGNKPFVGII